MDLQLKTLPLDAAGFKFADGDAGAFSGYIAHFGSRDSYGDVIEPGAFEATLKNRTRPVLLRLNHRSPLIGKWTDIREDEVGLLGQAELTPGHSLANDVRASMKHGALAGLSFAYTVPAGGAEERDGVRYLKRLNLIEAGPVEEPANINARLVSVKSTLPELKSLAEVEDFLRDQYGMTKSDACAFVSRVKQLDRSGDPDAISKAAAEIAELFEAKSITSPIVAAFRGFDLRR